MRRVVWLVAAAVIAAAVWVRLAPSDPAVWHAPGAEAAQAGVAADGAVRAGRGDARVALAVPGGPDQVLARLDAIALATPRTRRLAGSPSEGRITWVTRSAVWGFPDYTTASARAVEGGTRLDLWARLRFGGADFGVNARRLQDWVALLAAGGGS